jgi:predicted GNAT superfamily acetyltransferase
MCSRQPNNHYSGGFLLIAFSLGFLVVGFVLGWFTC